MNGTNVTRRRLLGSIGSTGLALCAMGTVTADGQVRYLVTVTGDTGPDDLEAEGFEVLTELADGSVLLVAGPDDAAADLEAISGVRAAAPDLEFEVDVPERRHVPDEGELAEHTETTLSALQWDKQVTNVLEAHERSTGAGATLAILDTGIDHDHPDLAANVDEERSALFSSGDPVDDHPWDVHGHGTHVAGIAAASQDDGAGGPYGTGVVGTAPDATLVSAKVFWYEDPEGDEGADEPFLTTTSADIFAAIDYAAEIGADAANLSLGTPPLPPEYNATGIRVAYQRVIQHASNQGTLVAASAGNSNANLQQGGFFTVPNSVPGAMSISATGPNDERSFYSNYGTNEIDVAAPGGGYETLEKTLCTEDGTVAGSCEEDEETGEVECEECDPPAWPFPTNLVLSSVPPEVYGVPYAYFAGTSMAAPQVTGLVGLVRDLAPNANANQVEQAIAQGADGSDGRSDPELGAGRIDAADTVSNL